jgi:hypothetical protein
MFSRVEIGVHWHISDYSSDILASGQLPDWLRRWLQHMAQLLYCQGSHDYSEHFDSLIKGGISGSPHAVLFCMHLL